uniref:Uncharacterized protein n=1 Tax=Anguilla anguilla TaxID=7936 RepID=A0A0E9PEI0_ANGAN
MKCYLLCFLSAPSYRVCINKS